MAAISYGINVPFGSGIEVPELSGFPEGRVRIRMRNDDFVKIRIKTDDGIKEFIPRESSGKWVPFAETGSNQRQ